MLHSIVVAIVYLLIELYRLLQMHFIGVALGSLFFVLFQYEVVLKRTLEWLRHQTMKRKEFYFLRKRSLKCFYFLVVIH